MVRVWVLLAAPLSACAALGASTPADSLACGSAEAARVTACPSEAALAAHLRDRWGLSAGAPVQATCAPGEFGERAWLVHARTGAGADLRGATFLLQPSCAALTDPAPRPLPADEPMPAFELHDLDGDHVDEVLARRAQVVGDARETQLEVYRLAAGRLSPAGKVRLARDQGGLRCTSEVRYLARPGGGLLIEVTASGLADDGCLPPGVHALELTAGGLRRVAP